MTLDELFPVTAQREHVRRVLEGTEQPRGYEFPEVNVWEVSLPTDAYERIIEVVIPCRRRASFKMVLE